jgi:hypothetical protein
MVDNRIRRIDARAQFCHTFGKQEVLPAETGLFGKLAHGKNRLSPIGAIAGGEAAGRDHSALGAVSISQSAAGESENVLRVTDQAAVANQDRTGNAKNPRLPLERGQKGVEPPRCSLAVVVDKRDNLTVRLSDADVSGITESAVCSGEEHVLDIRDRSRALPLFHDDDFQRPSRPEGGSHGGDGASQVVRPVLRADDHGDSHGRLACRAIGHHGY